MGPLLAVGAFPWVLGLLAGLVLGGLAGVLAALWSERWFDPPVDGRKLGRAVPTVAGVAAVGVVAITAGSLLFSEQISPAETEPQAGRVHWQTKNTSRFGAEEPSATSVQVAMAAFPSVPPSAVVLAAQDPIAVTAAAPLLRTVNGPLLLLDPSGAISPDVQAALRRWPQVPALVVGAPVPAQLSDRPAESLTGPDPEALFAAVNAQLTGAGLTGRPTVAVGGDARQLLPVAAWLAHEPSPLAWRTGGDYLYAGPEAVPDDGDQVRVGADQPVAHALRVAGYRDADTGVGWGIDDTEPESWHTAIIANPSAWQQAAAGLTLAGWGKPGPLLWTDPDGRLPRSVESFLWPLGPAFEATPAEGPFNHLWVLGSRAQVPFDTQARVDYLAEMQPVQTRGPGVTWVEFGVLLWLLAAGISAVWLLADATRRLPVGPAVIGAWFGAGLILGPIAVALYACAYRGRLSSVHNGVVMWQRPMWLQAAVATSRSVGTGTISMVLASATVFLIGSPLLPNDLGWFFNLGNQMVLVMFVIAYLAALVIATLAMAPMMRTHHQMTSGRRPSYLRALPGALRNMAINMTVLTVFMFAGMWIWMREFFQMGATQDQLFWWYAVLAGVGLGVLAIYPVNWWLVATGRKGGMT